MFLKVRVVEKGTRGGERRGGRRGGGERKEDAWPPISYSLLGTIYMQKNEYNHILYEDNKEYTNG